MTDEASPSAPADSGGPVVTQAPTPEAPPGLYATDNWHEFQAQLQAYQNAERATQHTSAPNSPEPKGVSKAVPVKQPNAPSTKTLAPPDPDPSATPKSEKPPEAVAEEVQEEPDLLNADEGVQTEPGRTDAELLERAREWESSDMVPDEFMDRLIEVPYETGSRVETLREAIKSVMRQSDHTRHHQAREAERAEEARRYGNIKAHFDAIGHPETGGDAMYEIYTRNGWRPQLIKVAERIAAEEQEDVDAANGMGYAVMQRLGIQDPKDYRVQEAIQKKWKQLQESRSNDAGQRAKDFKIQQLEQNQSQQGNEAQAAEAAATVKKQLDQLRPRAFKALGVGDNAKNQLRFLEHCAAIHRQRGRPPINAELVMDAARSLREELEDEARLRSGSGSTKPPTRTVGSASLGAGGAGKRNGASTQGFTVEELGQRIGIRGW